MAPITKVAPRPPASAMSGTATGQPWLVAYAAVIDAPSNSPAIPPSADSISDSARNWTVIWPRVAPRARRRPISPRRSSTEITMVLATPTPGARAADLQAATVGIRVRHVDALRAHAAGELQQLLLVLGGHLAAAVHARGVLAALLH